MCNKLTPRYKPRGLKKKLKKLINNKIERNKVASCMAKYQVYMTFIFIIIDIFFNSLTWLKKGHFAHIVPKKR